MRGDTGNAGGFSIGLDELPDNLLAQPVAPCPVCTVYRTEDVSIRQIRSRCPGVDCDFHPSWHGRCADSAVFANEVHDALPSVTLLKVCESERRHLGAPKPATKEHGQDGAFTQPAYSCDIWCAQQSL